MGWFDDIFGGGDQTITTRTEIDPERKAQSGTIWDTASAINELPYQPYGLPRVAPLSPTQMQAGDYLKGNTGSWKAPLSMAQLTGQGAIRWDDPSVPIRQQGLPGMLTAPTMPMRSAMAPPGIDPKSLPAYRDLLKVAGDPTGGSAMWDDRARSRFTNPYIDEVIGQIGKQADQARTKMGLRRAAQKAFGGSGQMLESAFIDEAAMDAGARAKAAAYDKSFDQWATETKLNQSGQQQAIQAATEAARIALSAEQGNQQAQLTVIRDNLAAALGVDRANADNIMRSILANQQAELTVSGRNLEAATTADRTNVDASLKNRGVNLDVAKLLRDLGMSGTDAMLKEWGALMGYGTAEQSTGQKQLDALFDEFNRAQGEPDRDLNRLISAYRALPVEQTQTRTGPGENASANVLSSLLMLAGIGGPRGFGWWGGTPSATSGG